MLPAAHRLRASDEFARTVRRGVRAGAPTLVVHAAALGDPARGDNPPDQVGFVVSKAVGNAVVRNRVKRRLRHQVAAVLAGQGAGGRRYVVRALPAAATTPGPELERQLQESWRRANRKLAAS